MEETEKNSSESINVPLFLYVFSKNRKIILFIFIFFGLLSFTYLRYATKYYNSYSLIQIRSSNKARELISSSQILPQEDIFQDIEFLRSKEFFKKALSQLPLEVSYFSKGRFLNFELYKSAPFDIFIISKNPDIIGIPIYLEYKINEDILVSYDLEEKKISKKFKVDEPIILPHFSANITLKAKQEAISEKFFVINDLTSVVEHYHYKTEVVVFNADAKTIKVSLNDETPRKAMDIVDHLAKTFLESDVERKSRSTNKVLDFINNQIQDIYNNLRASEDQIVNFQRNNKIDISGIQEPFYFQKSTELQDELASIQLNHKILKNILSLIESKDSISNAYQLLALMSLQDYSMSNQLDQLNRLLIQREEKLYEYKKNSNAIKILDYNIGIQKNVVKQSISLIINKLEAQREAITIKLDYYSNNAQGKPDQVMEFSKLDRIYKINEKFHSLLLEKKAEFDIARAGFISENIILSEPIVSNVVVSPNNNLIIGVLFAFAVIISFLLVIIRYLMHDTVSSVEDLIPVMNARVSVLGVVSKYTEIMEVSQLIVHKKPKSVISESFRNARTNLQFILNQENQKVVSVTSTVSGEGKTFIAINLAGILAVADKKVIVLDLDMRKPKIHVGFGTGNQKGMSTLLIQKEEVHACIHQSELPNLHFITAGPVPPNPSELILNGQLEKILEGLKQEYDYIIIDTPPSGLVTDALDCSAISDCLIYLFRAEYSKKAYVENINRIAKMNKFKNISIVFNNVDYKTGPYAYVAKYGYGYGKGYGKSYGYGYGTGYGYGDKSGYYE
jgi:tyrosine-protein kinase Etk/Wzc